MGEIQQTHPPHIVILPSPGMGHLIPLAALARRLPGVSATFLIPTDGSSVASQKAVLDGLLGNYVFLPPVDLSDLREDVKIETRISLIVARSLDYLREEMKKIMDRAHIVAMVVDLFGTDGFDVAKEFNVPSYIFYPSTATALALFLELPSLDEKHSCEYRELPEPVLIAGSVPLRGGDFLAPAQDRQNEAYTWLIHHCRRYKMAEGILVNSFMELEPGPLKYLTEPSPDRPQVYPIGPLVTSGGPNVGPHGAQCLKWLDEQPHGSVLFISFGSGGTLSVDQLTELAHGLEMSEQRFLWVVKSPSEKASNASYFTAKSNKDPFEFLPKGFLDRTKGFGLVVTDWAPQVQILGHDSTGGFLTHCGWNSTLESVVHGVPLIVWPLFAEQKMNAVMLEGMKLALRPKFGENGIISRLEITKVVKGLMEGEDGKEIRNKMKDLKTAATTALSEEGVSTRSLRDVVSKWKNQI